MSSIYVLCFHYPPSKLMSLCLNTSFSLITYRNIRIPIIKGVIIITRSSSILPHCVVRSPIIGIDYGDRSRGHMTDYVRFYDLETIQLHKECYLFSLRSLYIYHNVQLSQKEKERRASAGS